LTFYEGIMIVTPDINQKIDNYYNKSVLPARILPFFQKAYEKHILYA